MGDNAIIEKPRHDQLRPLSPSTADLRGRYDESLTLGEWVAHRHDSLYWRIAFNKGEGWEVETVWAGHDPTHNDPPLIFETTVYRLGHRLIVERVAAGDDPYHAHNWLVDCLEDGRALPDMPPESPAKSNPRPDATEAAPARGEMSQDERARRRAARSRKKRWAAARKWGVRSLWLSICGGIFLGLCQLFADHFPMTVEEPRMKPYVIDPSRIPSYRPDSRNSAVTSPDSRQTTERGGTVRP